MRSYHQFHTLAFRNAFSAYLNNFSGEIRQAMPNSLLTLAGISGLENSDPRAGLMVYC